MPKQNQNRPKRRFFCEKYSSLNNVRLVQRRSVSNVNRILKVKKVCTISIFSKSYICFSIIIEHLFCYICT